MQFSMKEWRKLYNLIQRLGQKLRDSRPTYDEHNNYYAPKIPMARSDQNVLERKMKSLVQRSSEYLDHCEVHPNEPLWSYDRANPDTHMSSPNFKYWHLVA